MKAACDEFKEFWNTHIVRTQRSKILPSGIAPNIAYDFPDKYGLTPMGVPVPKEAIQVLRDRLPVSRTEVFRWVSDEFKAACEEVWAEIGAPKLTKTNGWLVFNQMAPILQRMQDSEFDRE